MINKFLHNSTLVGLSPIFIYFGIKNIYFPINIFFIIIGILIIYMGNNSYQKDGDLLYLFEILVIGPLLFIIGITKNKYNHLKNLLCVIGFAIILYNTRSIFINSLRR
jgi:hypothetical protein